MDSVLHLVGIAKKAGKLELGEEPVGAAARARQAKLILVAADAAENSARRAAHFAEGGKAPWVRVPFSKAELGATVGRASCAMLALTDAGLAASLAGRLAAGQPELYGALAAELGQQAERVLQRQRERRAHEKKLREGKRKPWAAPPQPPKGKAQARRPAAEPGTGPAKPKTPAKRPLPRGVVSIHVNKRKKTP